MTGQESAALPARTAEPGKVDHTDTKPSYPRCASPRWVSVSLDGGFTRRAQCVPCGAVHDPVIGPGWRSPGYGDPEAEHPNYRQEINS